MVRRHRCKGSHPVARLAAWAVASSILLAAPAALAQDAPDPAPEPAPGPGDTYEEPPESPPENPDAPDARKRALELHDEAKKLYATGQYRAAVAKLRKAVELDPKAKLLHYNLGLIHEKLGDVGAALEHFQLSLALQKNDREKRRLEATIRRLEGAREEIAASRPIRQGTVTRVVEEIEAPGPSKWTYAAAGTAVGAAAIGAGLAIAAGSIDPGAQARTGPDVTVDQLADDASTAHKLAVTADVFFGLAVASGVASVVLAATTRAPTPTAPINTRVEVTWRGTGVGATWHF